MKRINRLIGILVCVFSLSLLFSVSAFAAPPENGWYTRGYTYYYENGEPVTGWKEIDGKWYFFNGKYDSPSYAMKQNEFSGYSGFLDRGYYFGSDGAMVTNKWASWERVHSPGTAWSYYGADGKAVKGWNFINGEWYFFAWQSEDSYWKGTSTYENLNGELVTTESYEMICNAQVEIAGKTYLFKESGAMYTGWEKQEDGTWKYYKPNGAMAVSEAVWVKNKGYIFDENGIMLTGEQERDGKSYLLSDSGAMYTGWKKLDDGSWIYYKADGAMAKDEWVMVKNKWFLFDAEGIMRTGLLERYDHTYYFNDNGSMATGWKKLDGVWYYFRPAENDNGPAGSMVKDSWVLSGNKWYYIGSDGIMVTGTKEIYSGNYGKSDEYYFSDSGAMQTGWHHVNGNWHFYRTSTSANGPQGSMAKGVWVPAGSFWYFTDYTDGAMVLGWKDIEGKRYYFSDDANHYGQMVTGKQVIDGKAYTFDDDGALVK